jgi:RimJ/RimL family protein N-acetyltransferase
VDRVSARAPGLASKASSTERRVSAVLIYGAVVSAIETDRLTIRAPVEGDRARFVELFTDEAFTVFSDGVHDVESANARFDGMLTLAELVPYAKQPVIVRATDTIIGYTGVGTVLIDGVDRLEWGWRLAPEARGLGYATEATAALLARADVHDNGEVLCIIAVDNVASRRVADRVGFRWQRRVDWMGDPSDRVDLLERSVGAGGPHLLAPHLA